MQLSRSAFVIGTCLLAVAGEEKKQAAPHQLSAELRAKYWRVEAEALAAQIAAEKVQSRREAIYQDMMRSCEGEMDTKGRSVAQLVRGQDGEPTCQAKPEPPKQQAP